MTSILITKLTFARFLLKLSTLSGISAAIFLFVSLVLWLCGRSTGVFQYFFFSIRCQTLILDCDKFILALFIVFDRPEILSNLNFVYESRLAFDESDLQGGILQHSLSDVDIRH